MSFGGHVLDMIKRANQSKGSGSSRFKKIRDLRKELRVEIIITGAVLFIFFLGMYFFISYLFS